MAMIRFDDIDDMFGRVDRMMNSVMRNMFGDNMSTDPYGFNSMMSNTMMNPFGRFHHHSYFPQQSQSMSVHHNLFNPSSAYYCSSSVMSMSTDANGRPQIYEATSSTRNAPNGLRETRSTVRDSLSGYHQMSIGHHINDRGHVMQRSRNHYTGEQEENEEYVNMDEAEGPQFNEEWRRHVSEGAFRGDYRHHRRSLPQMPHTHRHSASPQLALPAPESAPSTSQSHGQDMQKNKMSHKEKKQKEKKSKKPYKKH